jgi:uncharacterized protein (TIGR00375 family)
VLKDEFRRDFDRANAFSDDLPNPREDGSGSTVRFVLTGEISTIYSKGGKTRKVHHLILLPDLEAAAAFQAKLEGTGGNIRSDGRPILGLDSRDLLELLLETDPRSMLIPAHIWTPWFSALGGRSGFDSINECYRDLSSHIGAIETGLSSNPPMNWALSLLDRFAIISNSDAHSPDKLGREATVFDTELSYPGLRAALAGGNFRAGAGILKTIEFFPQEGKYHYDGHRICGVCFSPEEMRAAAGICPVCGKPLTGGVLSRVMELADRPVKEDRFPPDIPEGNKRPYHSLIPLKELLAELLEAGAASKKTVQAYTALIKAGGSELSILMEKSLEELERLAVPGIPGPLLAAAIDRMRRGEVSISVGYDGEYGIIRAFPAGAVPNLTRESGLFGDEPPPEPAQTARPAVRHSARECPKDQDSPGGSRNADRNTGAFFPDAEQEQVVNHSGGPALIIAGPGTGKTSVLARRIARIIADRPELAGGILALSFTVKAAEELRERIAAASGKEKAALLTVGTFHSLGRSILKAEAPEAGIDPGFNILDAEARDGLIKNITLKNKRGQAGHLGSYIEERKRFLLLPGESAIRLGPGASPLLDGLIGEINATRRENSPRPEDPASQEGLVLDKLYGIYRDRLKEMNVLDFDDLLAGTVRLLAAKPAVLAKYRAKFPVIFADEYQDSNFAQYALLRLLAGQEGEGGEICVIGDPNQAIYGFRGADSGYLDRFLRDYPGAAIFRLSRSFRCAGPIAQAANRLSAAGSADAGIQGTDAPARLYRSGYPSGKAEAEGIARQISALIGGTGFFALDSGVANGSGSLTSLGQCAILLRAIALSPPFEEALSSHGIPYRLMGEDLEDLRWSKEELALMTIHASKGLEFDQVFVPALEDGILPFTLFGKNSGVNVEEERRLLYVAMTRARTGLHLSWANSRRFRGRQLTLPPSPFLVEIEKLIPKAASPMPRRDKNLQPNLFGE